MSDKYITRIAEKELELKLNSAGCVLVSGPKFSGKSTMCKRQSRSDVSLNTNNNILLAQADPKSVLLGEYPRLIDEWQKAPDIWNIIKEDLDNNYVFGKYILTGSTTPVDSKMIHHSGAGRIASLMLKPFTLYESSESSGLVSLGRLFEDSDIPTIFAKDNQISLSDIAFMICRGGWPVSVKAEKAYALSVTENYYSGLFRIENESDDFVEFLKNKDINLLLMILKSYARNISTQSKKTSMINDIIESGERSVLDDQTFNTYAKTLKDLFIVYDMPAWNKNLRSSVTVRVSPTHHFVDTSIATNALGINPSNLMDDLKSFGYFFEDFVIRDLSVYAQANKASLKHYLDSAGQEVDAIVEMPNGDYGAVEIKIASEKNINEGIRSLNTFENKMIKNKLNKPKFKMIVTSHGACYKNDDGILIIPITYLKD